MQPIHLGLIDGAILIICFAFVLGILTPRTTEADVLWHKRPAALGVLVLFMALILNILFW